MTSSGAAMWTSGGNTGEAEFPGMKQRPSFRVSDIWRTPLHDFPMRDEILYQWLPLTSTARILEIGSGSGFTAFRLSRQVAQVTSVDIAAQNVKRLQETYDGAPNLDFVCADVSSSGFPDEVPGQFDVVFGLDFFEYVVDPRTCIENLAAAVRPGGFLLLQWPNYPPARSGGVTYIPTYAELSDLLATSGLCTWQTFALQLRPHAAALFRFLHESPLRYLRRLRRSDGKHLPQVFDDTWAFQRGQRLESYKALIHAYWAALSAAMRIGGNCFKRKRLDGGSLECNLLLLARR